MAPVSDPIPDAIAERAKRIQLVLMDCDGVLTDGRIELIDGHDEQKTFHTRDGHGIVLLHRAGLSSGIISGRTSNQVVRRAAELGMSYVKQGTHNKTVDYAEIIERSGIDPNCTAFIGDDITDIPLMLRSGFAVAVADAVPETKEAAHLVTSLPGGFGAVREVCELILKAQGRWTELMQRYLQ
jgi:3-deoxy-D-manno-octulosonate 8-phosphate phosphatase (KDO 8-P phosphatase)